MTMRAFRAASTASSSSKSAFSHMAREFMSSSAMFSSVRWETIAFCPSSSSVPADTLPGLSLSGP